MFKIRIIRAIRGGKKCGDAIFNFLFLEWDFCDSGPVAIEPGVLLEFADEMLVERRGLDDLAVLQFLGQVAAIVLTDILDGLRRQEMGLRRYAHGVEDVLTGGNVTAEGTGGDSCQLG